ncbi:hypothetical protein ACQPYK_23680 [Streptosporangium sp. CA-135522]|uniref:hypothetical protein n=1 Tax=Streptosporangium sp. CA-135522 TaxID=3240072 RepID=UPI003D9104A6
MIDTDPLTPAMMLEQVGGWLTRAGVAKVAHLVAGDAPAASPSAASMFTATYTALGGPLTTAGAGWKSVLRRL